MDDDAKVIERFGQNAGEEEKEGNDMRKAAADAAHEAEASGGKDNANSQRANSRQREMHQRLIKNRIHQQENQQGAGDEHRYEGTRTIEIEFQENSK